MDKALTYRKMGLKAALACVLAAVLACAAWAALPTASAYAAENGSITITFIGSDTHGPIVGMESRAYKVASYTDASGSEMVLDGDYKKLANILGWKDAKASSEQDASWWQKQAKTMDCYVRHHAYEPHSTDVTDENGTVVFSGLDEGLYLVVNLGDGIHRFDSSLVSIGGQKEYQQVVEPKNVTPAKPYTEIKVVKHWMGDITDEADRPQNVVVQLMQGDEAYGDPIELNDSNNWTYTWSGLDTSQVYYWDVVEINPPDRYSIAIDEYDGTFTITNTLLPHPPFSFNVEVEVSKQEVGGGAELPGATLQIIDSDGTTVEEFVSAEEPHRFSLSEGEYVLRETAPPSGYDYAEDMRFRITPDATVECLKDGEWVDATGQVVMEDRKLEEGEEPTPKPTPEVPTREEESSSKPPTPATTSSVPPTTPPTTTSVPPTETPRASTATTPSATTTTVAQTAAEPARLPQTGQLWWPVPVLIIAGILAIGVGRIIAFRSRG